MFASRLGVPWKYAAALTLVGAIAAAAVWPRAHRRTASPPPPPLTWVELHVKLRAEATVAPRLASGWGTPVFTHLPAGTHDARARWLDVWIPVPGPGDVDRAIAAVASDPAVELALRPAAAELARIEPSPAADDDAESCPITTPSFESYQGYLGPAPHGIDAPAAWRRGARGQGVWFADVEGGWNPQHEDLPGDRIELVGGRMNPDPDWRAHGTAVLGEVVGADNARGVVGIAPDVERVLTSSVWGQSLADAIDTPAELLRAGDVLLIELQLSGPRGRYVPVELNQAIFDAIQAATSRGVIVIEAAGNGGEDLDHRFYRRAFDRRTRDSGAILVGAGGPPRGGYADRERLDFSNYGSRVDVQGWGRQVATLDYGDLQTCAGADRHYTDRFAGTSSASPIVAGAAVLLEGIARQRGRVLSPAELARLLRRTGTPQVGDLSEPIGPRPDLARAISELH
jgi:subtilisin family serine protease